jgi:uncharacterized repeat protein (TIGR01451 family)
MRGKLIGFAVALLSVATIGVVQLTTTAAEPGKVGNAPRCTVTAVGNRASAFKVNGANTNATVKYNVKGAKNCKAQISLNSFYAPSMNGKPYDKQILFKRITRIVTPGTYKGTIALPTEGPSAKGCFWQIDLTYGTRNIQPVIAYGHGKVNGCKPQPAASCKNLSANKIEDNKYRLTAKATVKNGAKIKGYDFIIKNNGKTVKTIRENTANASKSVVYTAPTDGKYAVQLKVRTTQGVKTAQNCVAKFSVKKPETPTPGVEIDKLVENVDYAVVETNVEYEYQIKVTNTGETDLTDVNVSDTPEQGVTLLSADKGTVENNTWTYTIPELKIGEDMSFTLSAKVPEFLSGRINNTACVDAPGVPGSPDDCDDAEVEVEEPGKTIVCDPETGETISVSEQDADKYVPVDSEECTVTETPETPAVPKGDNPEVLPYTGPADVAMQVIGAMSLAGAGSYYYLSRRQG